MPDIYAQSDPRLVFSFLNLSGRALTQGEVRAVPSRRRVGTGRFLEPLDHLRRRYHTFRQMRIERARADIWVSASFCFANSFAFSSLRNVSVAREKARFAGDILFC